MNRSANIVSAGLSIFPIISVGLVNSLSGWLILLFNIMSAPRVINTAKNENNNNMEYSPETVRAVRAELEENMKKIGDSCQKLEELEKSKSEISDCKKSLEDFKSKGMNVDSALAPLDAQYNEVVGKLNGFATSLNDVNKNLKTLLESMN